ncbi:MAG: DUF3459 domain-containing protein [Microbacterium sp.]
MPDPNDPATFGAVEAPLGRGVGGRPSRPSRAIAPRATAPRRPELTGPDRAGQTGEHLGPGRWVLRRGEASVFVNLSGEVWDVEIGDGQEVWVATTTAHDGPVEQGPLTLSADSAAVIGPRLAPRQAEEGVAE